MERLHNFWEFSETKILSIKATFQHRETEDKVSNHVESHEPPKVTQWFEFLSLKIRSTAHFIKMHHVNMHCFNSKCCLSPICTAGHK